MPERPPIGQEPEDPENHGIWISGRGYVSHEEWEQEHKAEIDADKEKHQTTTEKERQRNEARFETSARSHNESGFPWERVFKRKITPIDAAHEEALTDDKEFNIEKAKRDARQKEEGENNEYRRERYEAIGKEIDTLIAALSELEKASPLDTVAITAKRTELSDKIEEQRFWGQQR